jgi:hypothetical protein
VLPRNQGKKVMRLFRVAGFGGVLALVAATTWGAAAQAASCTLDGLQWIKGVWQDHSEHTQVEERWTIGPDHRLLGSSYALHPGAPGGVIEAMTIAPDGTEISMRIRHFDGTLDHAREEKDAPMIFAVTGCGPDSLTLDGRGTQIGERMTYRRDGDKLFFVGDFIHQGKPVRAEEAFARVGE